jgi:hypothetical protein
MSTLLLQVAVSTAFSVGLGLVERALTPRQRNYQEGSRLTDSKVTYASESGAIARHWGRNRIGGNIIWSSRLKETKKTTTTETQGGKGGGGGGAETTQVTYTYSVSFAVAFCEGNNRTQLGRVWADGKLMDLSHATYRFYQGTENQTADSYIETIEGAGNVPGYRGICYLVFEELQLADYGNRIPQITAEIIKGSNTIGVNELESVCEGVSLIPGVSEFAYGTNKYIATDGKAVSKSQNVHNNQKEADLIKSLDVMQASAPNIKTVSLVVGWFGDDLRCGNCTVKPKVEQNRNKIVQPYEWYAGSLSRSQAEEVSHDALSRPYYGGTPSDRTIREAIIELKSRGMRVVLYPFLFMDIPPNNTLNNPYSDNSSSVGQSAFPWRGRITVSPAAGYAGTADKTPTAAAQISSFMGTASAGNFGSWNGSTIPYGGPNEWSYRRFILHYAKLASDLLTSGDAFIIGSEMVTLTQSRENSSSYPYVSDLVTLANDVNAILPSGVLLSYAANWSEYHSHRPGDGSNDVYFNLDPLWSSPNIDFIGIDNYMPISDWRDGATHTDYLAGYKFIYQSSYLQSNIEGGEYYDWYYASDADRASQTRTPITDGAYSKPWIYRNKDIKNWWSNMHINRPGGVESGIATSYLPESKPIWFTEYGCPAVDKGTNQPNVFIDPKSSESSYPYFSKQTRDDLIQRRYVEEMNIYWRDHSPISSIYGDRMIKPSNMIAWTWDARPYPEFPYLTKVWSDGDNWRLGHWLTGRLPMITLPSLVAEICSIIGFATNDIDVSKLYGAYAVVRGFTITEMATPRSMLETLQDIYFFDAYQSEGKIHFILREYPESYELNLDDVVTDSGDKGGYSLKRSQETSLPKIVKVTYLNERRDFQDSTVSNVRPTGHSQMTKAGSYSVVIPEEQARSIAQTQLMEAWTARETGKVTLPLSKLAIDPGDVLSLTIKNHAMTMRVKSLDISASREASLVGFDVSNYDGSIFAEADENISETIFFGPSTVEFMDLPLLTENQLRPWAPHITGFQEPWPGQIEIYEDDNNSGWMLNSEILGRGVIGVLTSDLYKGPTDTWDYGNKISVQIYSNDQILGTSELSVYNGDNLACIQNSSGGWEVLQFQNATLTGTRTYILDKLLRGQGGTEMEMRDPVLAGAKIVFLSLSNLYSLNISQATIFSNINFRYGPYTVDVTDFRYQEENVKIGAVGLRPYSPVHLSGKKSGNDWILSWVRRSRFNADSWAPESVPLNEEKEEYELEIMSGAMVFRTIKGITSPSFTYTSAMQIEDFGSNQSTVIFRVYQMSVIYGRGAVAEGKV